MTLRDGQRISQTHPDLDGAGHRDRAWNYDLLQTPVRVEVWNLRVTGLACGLQAVAAPLRPAFAEIAPLARIQP
jgi:hypothetical protein